MTSRISIYDHYCRPLVDFSNIPTTPRGWVKNGYGRCQFSIGFDPTVQQSAQLWQERYFQYGNLVHIEHIPSQTAAGVANGKLPSWTGIILPERNWDYGVGHVTAYSAEAILAFRAMPYVSVKNTPKNVMQQIINIVHERAKNITIQPGTLDDLPITFPDDLRLNAYDHIQKMVKYAGMDWDITGKINIRGNLDLLINLYQKKGVDTAVDLNNMNTELVGGLLSEQGTPSNQVYGYSHAQTARSRFSAEAIHQEAYDDYGPLQLNQVFVGVHDATGTQHAAQQRAADRGRPVWKIKRNALDNGDIFDHLNTGNTLNVVERNAGFNPNGGYGFEKQVRILSMDYNDLTNKCSLNLEVV